MEFAVCPNCGQQVIARSGGAYEVCPGCGSAVQVGAGPVRFPKWAIWAIAGGSLAVILIIAIVAIATSGSSKKPDKGQAAYVDEDFESANRSRIMDLNTQADDLARAGRLNEARATYRKILEISANQKVRDRDLLAIIMAARADHDRLGREGAYSPESDPLNPFTSPTTRLQDKPLIERKPMPSPVADLVRDDQIERAIRRGVAWLKAQHRGGHFTTEPAGPGNPGSLGRDSLATYALLQAGYAIKDEQLTPTASYATELLDGLSSQQPGGSHVTYTRSLRALALGLYGRSANRKTLTEDVEWLIAAGPDGAYGYNTRAASAGGWDNSNSQYGLLGVWAGADRDIDVPPAYWKSVETHWTTCRLPDGRWGYNKGNPTFSMTCAGLASLFVALDHGESRNAGIALGADPYPKALADGLAWLEKGDNSVNLGLQNALWSAGYNIYALERVGLASGYKYFGPHDWYRELSRRIVDEQRPDGSWNGLKGKLVAEKGEHDPVIVETSYMLLFLSRGRHPILMNKLRYDGGWSNRPRDLANLARYSGYMLERPLNWQVVSIDKDWTDWTDSPIIYLAGHEPPKLTDAQVANIGRFVRAGGLLFTNADGDSEAFNRFAAELAGRLFPDYPLKDLPRDHEIYGVVARIGLGPRLQAVSNGSRLLMVHSPLDIAQPWHLRSETVHRNRFELGLNIFVYAAGKQTLRGRLSSPFIPMPEGKPAWTVPVARLKFSGNWNPEPYAIERFSAALMTQTGWKINVAETPLNDLTIKTAPLALLTGTGTYTPTQGEIDALKAYIQAGGIVLIDSCGGDAKFAAGARELVEKAFASVAGAPSAAGAPTGGIPASLQSLTAQHPILKGAVEGMDDLTTPLYRPYNLSRRSLAPGTPAAGRGEGGGEGLQILESGRGAVIYSPQDITTGLLGTHTWSILGFQPAYATGLLKNIVLWTEDRDK